MQAAQVAGLARGRPGCVGALTTSSRSPGSCRHQNASSPGSLPLDGAAVRRALLARASGPAVPGTPNQDTRRPGCSRLHHRNVLFADARPGRSPRALVPRPYHREHSSLATNAGVQLTPAALGSSLCGVRRSGLLPACNAVSGTTPLTAPAGEDDGREPADVSASGADVTVAEVVQQAAPGAEAGVAERKRESILQLIWKGVRPPLYSVAFIPLLVGAALAYLETGVFHPGRFWSFLFHSVLVIAWLNLSNDGFDASTGVDKEKKESVVNMLGGNQTVVLVGAFACLAVGLTGLFRGAVAVGDLRVFRLLAAAIACGYVYQCPPFRLSYKGLGEPLCFVAFGPLATSAFYLYQANAPGAALAAVSPTVWAASALVGITTTLILFCSHFHQIEGDFRVGKMSPLVRLGTQRGALVATVSVALLYAATAASCAAGVLPWTCLATAALSLPVARTVVGFVNEHHQDKGTIFKAKYFCVRLHVAFGLLLALGLRLGRVA